MPDEDIDCCVIGLFQAGGGEKKEHLYKILVIGELGTGKTSIIKRYVHQYFSQHYRATVSLLNMRCRIGLGVRLRSMRPRFKPFLRPSCYST